MVERYVETAMGVLIGGPGQTLGATLKQALVPSVHEHAVSKRLRQSPLITRTTDGVLHHAWQAALIQLRAAGTPVHCSTWATVHAVPMAAEFARYVRSHPAQCEVTLGSHGTVRAKTTLDAHNSESMRVALRSAGLAGVQRTTLIAEYPEAYTDLLRLQQAHHVFATAERVWDLPPLPAQLINTDAFESSSTTPPTCAET